MEAFDRRTALLAAAAVAGVAFLVASLIAWSGEASSAPGSGEVGPQVHADGGPTLVVHATWAFRPESVEQLVAESPAVVVASVTDVREGAPLYGDRPDEPHAAIPTQEIDLRVDDPVYGDVPAEFTLLQAGAPKGQGLEGSPPYSVGERYVLAIEESQFETGAFYVPPAPDGRLRIEGGELDSLIPGPVGDTLDGLTPPEAEQLITSAVEQQ